MGGFVRRGDKETTERMLRVHVWLRDQRLIRMFDIKDDRPNLQGTANTGVPTH